MPLQPQEMKAVEIGAFGAADQLRPVRLPTPKPGPGEVLIQVAAAGINRPDILQRKGAYPPPPDASPLPGLEVAGRIVALGPDAAGAGVVPLATGMRVCALVAGGGYAGYCVAPAATCLPVPARLSSVQAAAIPETFFTVWTNVFDRGRLQPEETLLVHGGSSGIGTTAIQLAKAFGARVFVTAGSDEKCAACETLGADLAINYRSLDFVRVIRQVTLDRGVDVILDMVGGDYLPRNIACLAIDGRHVSIAVQRGKSAEIDIADIMRRRLTLTGSTLRPRSVAEKGEIARALFARVWPWLESGAVGPVLDRVFPLEQAAEAHAWMEQGAHVGKIVLKMPAP